MSSKHRKVRGPIARLKIIERKNNKFWKKAKKREYEDKILKWSSIVRQRNEVINRILYFWTPYIVESNAFVIEEMTLPLEINIP